MILSTLRLFNAILIDPSSQKFVPQSTSHRSILKGYLLDPSLHQLSDEELTNVESIIGISGEKSNSSFHKSWKLIQNSSYEDLLVQQVAHYISTYGFENLGCYHQDLVYIPAEDLKLPEQIENIPFTVVHAITKQELHDRIISLSSSIALSKETLSDLMVIIKSCHYHSSIVDKISNNELKSLLNSYFELIPTQPIEYLRYIVTKLTGQTLLIKSDAIITKLSQCSPHKLDKLLEKAPTNLGEIFYRFKPMFLALKKSSTNKSFFNKLRKSAVTLHKPLARDYLNSVTNQLKKGSLVLDELSVELENVTTFRKIRLAYALNHRLTHNNTVVYRVRNGRAWACKFDWPSSSRSACQQSLDLVLQSIVNDLRPKVNGKTFLIPKSICYGLPSSEKQFLGNFPQGTYVTVPHNLIIGIQWMNTKRRIDLDLSVIGESGKIGWDASFFNKERSVLFSGDVTDAPPPHGASELFYIKKGVNEARVFSVNYYNYSSTDSVDCKFIAASESPKSFKANYMVNIENIIASANFKLSTKQSNLGLLCEINQENRVYFSAVNVGNSITATNNEHCNIARKYLVSNTVTSLDLNNLLLKAGATIIHSTIEEDYIDLSPQSLQKDTFIELLSSSDR